MDVSAPPSVPSDVELYELLHAFFQLRSFQFNKQYNVWWKYFGDHIVQARVDKTQNLFKFLVKNIVVHFTLGQGNIHDNLNKALKTVFIIISRPSSSAK